jgi:hypothetical protein
MAVKRNIIKGLKTSEYILKIYTFIKRFQL